MVNILVGCTGSVASIKLPLLLTALTHNNVLGEEVNVRVIVTERSLHFIQMEDIPTNIEVFRDENEWTQWCKRGDPVLHIELAKWADIFVIAPLDANTMAKIANGLCDNLLTCTTRAWELSKPLLFCPAMNTKMFEHPLTSQQIKLLQSWGYSLIPTICKTLMCGDTGDGAMAEVDTIVQHVREVLHKT